jgi:hypothetical protein
MRARTRARAAECKHVGKGGVLEWAWDLILLWPFLDQGSGVVPLLRSPATDSRDERPGTPAFQGRP